MSVRLGGTERFHSHNFPETMPRPSNFFKELAGVPVHYDRFANPPFNYGSRGKPYTFYSLESFEKKLDAFFSELWQVCPLGKAEVITSAGAYVAKPGSHGQGRGFDIDAIFWNEKSFITLRYPQDRSFYLGVEAVLRKHLGTVLNYEYDVAHQDHFHVDDTSPVGFFVTHRSRVLFVQMALTHVYGRPVSIDGFVGPETATTLRNVLLDGDLASPGDVATNDQVFTHLSDRWIDFLNTTAAVGFGSAIPAEEEEDPLDLIENLYAVIDDVLAGHPDRKRVESGLTAFVNHEKTDEWLEQFRDVT